MSSIYVSDIIEDVVKTSLVEDLHVYECQQARNDTTFFVARKSPLQASTTLTRFLGGNIRRLKQPEVNKVIRKISTDALLEGQKSAKGQDVRRSAAFSQLFSMQPGHLNRAAGRPSSIVNPKSRLGSVSVRVIFARQLQRSGQTETLRNRSNKIEKQNDGSGLPR